MKKGTKEIRLTEERVREIVREELEKEESDKRCQAEKIRKVMKGDLFVK